MPAAKGCVIGAGSLSQWLHSGRTTGLTTRTLAVASDRAERLPGLRRSLPSGAADDRSAWLAAEFAAGGVVTQPLSQRPWGELAFDAVIAGYRFLISQEPASGDL